MSSNKPVDRTTRHMSSQTSVDRTKELLKPDNLFHSFTNSPSPDIRRRAAFIKANAYCPHPSHRVTRLGPDPNGPSLSRTGGQLPPARVSYECPDCGIPISCCEDHLIDNYERHLEICDILRQINQDDHDLRSGRFFPEFEYPGPMVDEAQVNMTNWDTLLYSRQFNAINQERSLRHATRLLTYPLTIGSVLHELSPYHIRKGGRLTVEGLKSLSGKLKTPFATHSQSQYRNFLLTHFPPQQPYATRSTRPDPAPG